MYSINQRAGAKLPGTLIFAACEFFQYAPKKRRVCVLILLYASFYLEERKINEGTGGETHLQNKLDTQLFCYNTLLQHHFALNAIPTEKITAWHRRGGRGDLLLVLHFLRALFTVWRTWNGIALLLRGPGGNSKAFFTELQDEFPEMLESSENPVGFLKCTYSTTLYSN